MTAVCYVQGKISRELFENLGSALPVSPIDGYQYSEDELVLKKSGQWVAIRKK